MGINASNTAEVHFDNVRVPRENLLGGKYMQFSVVIQVYKGTWSTNH